MFKSDSLRLYDKPTVKKLKPVYFNPYEGYIKFTSLDIDDVITVAYTSGQTFYKALEIVFNLEPEFEKRSDLDILNIVAYNLEDKDTRYDFIDILDYLRVRWLGDMKLSKNEFNYISKIIIDEVFDKYLEIKKFIVKLSNERKCELIRGIYAAILFNRLLVKEV